MRRTKAGQINFMKHSTSASVKFGWISLEKPTCSIRQLKDRPWALALACVAGGFSWCAFRLRFVKQGIQKTEEKAEPRSNEKTIGEGGRGTDRKTASIEPMKFVLYVFFLLPHLPSFSHLTSVQLFEQLYLLLNQKQAINITKKIKEKKKEIERSRGEERRKLLCHFTRL